MSMIITAESAAEMLSSVLWALKAHSNNAEQSRNGPVVRLPGVTTLEYTAPRQRLIVDARRDANPFFHLAECIWMLAGRDDLAFIQQFNSRMSEYAEQPSPTAEAYLHGAYGYRWRNFFAADQIPQIINLLVEEPTTRRAVLQMWDGDVDLDGQDKKDLPCNLSICFSVSPEMVLDMTVFNRSNDAVWGACGANVVHMSFLHEFIANATGYFLGTYRQVSNNMHLYTEQHGHFLKDPNIEELMYPLPIAQNITTRGEWATPLDDCESPCDGGPVETELMTYIVSPMLSYHLVRKYGIDDYNRIKQMPDCDWKFAAQAWIAHHDALNTEKVNDR